MVVDLLDLRILHSSMEGRRRLLVEEAVEEELLARWVTLVLPSIPIRKLLVVPAQRSMLQ